MVVTTPVDVAAEREILTTVLDDLNRSIAADNGLKIEVSRWETDAYVGFHTHSPKGLIDAILCLEECDVFLGVFWRQFGTPTKAVESTSTEEPLDTYDEWKGRPTVMVCFNKGPYSPQSKEETDKWGEVLEFQRILPKGAKWWTYNRETTFEKLIRHRLIKTIQHYSKEGEALQALVNTLRRESPDLRWDAAYRLGQIGGQRAITALANALGDEHSYVRGRAIDALSQIGGERAAEALVSAFKNPDRDVRARSAKALVQMEGEQAVVALANAFSDRDRDVRWRAASTLGQLGGDQAVAALVGALSDQDSYVRRCAADALAHIGGEQAAVALVTALGNHHRYVRGLAVYALGEVGGERALKALIAALNDHDSYVRSRCIDALGEVGDEQALGALVGALRHADRDVRWRAANTLGNIGGRQAVAALVDTLKDEDSYVRGRVADALAHIGGEEAATALIDALRDKDNYVRWRSADALAQLGGEQAVDALVDLLRDEDSYVRGRAADALAQIGGERAVAALVDKLNDEDGNVRGLAADALSQIGGERAAVALVRALEHIGREKALEETRAFIVHEVRSALGPLRMVAKKLNEGLSQFSIKPEKVSEFAERILEQTDAAYTVVDQYVNYSRQLKPVKRSTNINQLLIESLNEMRTQCEGTRIDIVQELGEVPISYIDPGLISQALRNIFLNAIEAIAHDGTVTVTTRHERGWAIISISDTGPGIKPEHLGRVFDLGFTTKIGAQGAGLGMVLVRRLVEEGNRGRVTVANNADGPGAIVSIELPTGEEG